mmetsp:Transcript_23463/g.49280  ORF Transcript_23463/g.49280 Transcript_23463/m.49280 type:complete len:330 (-) Transcript_23463:214-1203(-)
MNVVAVRVNWCVVFLFLSRFDNILSFRATQYSCARQQLETPFRVALKSYPVIGKYCSSIKSNTNRVLHPFCSNSTNKMAATDGNDNENVAAPSSSSSNPLASLGLPEPMLLGSASFTRKLILGEMGVPFSKFVRSINEKALGDRSQNAPPRELVLLLANAKMDRLVQELTENTPDDLPEKDGDGNGKGWVVLTGDQVVTCGGKILEKPESVEEAKEMVKGYAASPPSTVGSVVLYHHPSGIRVDGVDTATIRFNPETLGGEGYSVLIDSLIEQGEPVMSCAGGLMIEHPLTQHHVDRIDGTEDSVMGLSKDLVSRLLQELAEKLQNNEQ